MARTVTDAAALRASYETDGYAIARGVVPLDLVAEMRAHVDFLRARYPTIPTEHLHHLILRNDPCVRCSATARCYSPDDTPTIRARIATTPYGACRFWTRVCAEPALVELARAFAPFLSDGNVALFSSHYFHKQPRTGAAVLWHQDGAYWPLRPMNVLTLWVAVTESDRGNGCLRVVRGTHTAPLGELRPDRSVHNVLGSATHSDADVAALGWADRVVDLELAPGDVSIHHPNVVHGSAANTSDRARCGLTIRYISASTACTDPEQPVMMMAGQAVPGVNAYRSW